MRDHKGDTTAHQEVAENRSLHIDKLQVRFPNIIITTAV